MTAETEQRLLTPTEPPERERPAAPAGEAGDLPPLPDDALILLPVRNVVLFPGVVLPVTVGRRKTVAAAQEAVRRELPVGLILQRSAEDNDPAPADLHRIGTAAGILRYLTGPDGSHHAVCQGQQRFRVVEFLDGFPFFAARVERFEEPPGETKELEARLYQLKQRALEALQLLPQTPQELVAAVQAISNAGNLADLVASYMDLASPEKQEVLETFDIAHRVDKVLGLLAYRIEVLKLSQQIGEQTKEQMSKQQRDYVLREQLRQIQKELGEGDGKSAEIDELRGKIEAAGMPEEAEREALKELRRLEQMPEAAGEYSMVRTYLDWLIELPWQLGEQAVIDIAHARATLDEDHYGLAKVKRRILEYLAVRKLTASGKTPILCFVGPPGVGKTSLGQSIARAMGRKFVRISLGGVHDEAEIRGHRRTYIGALPGNIIQAVRKAGARDAVFMLDEMDKLGAGGFHGDPSAALLEVLDPEQNGTFRDNYLGITYDLSSVFFIGTANVLDSIPGPLRDRMEVIELPGYTEDEKLEIAKRYLVKRQLKANGVTPEQAEITDAALRSIIRDYTREAGCRNLEREIGGVFRHLAMRIAEGHADKTRIDAGDLPEILGAQRFENEVAMRTAVPGVATGLAWTPTGGDILFIEATRMAGRGSLILTGQLGDVMKESAQAALSLIKSRAAAFGIDETVFEKSDIHVHVPAGAIPKDGPSAGVAMFTALVSLLTGRCVRNDLAMTGEISLRGLVLPIGGVKEKATAAARAGLKTVMLPARNRKDLEDVPQAARDALEFVWLDDVTDAVDAAIGDCRVEPPPVPSA